MLNVDMDPNNALKNIFLLLLACIGMGKVELILTRK